MSRGFYICHPAAPSAGSSHDAVYNFTPGSRGLTKAVRHGMTKNFYFRHLGLMIDLMELFNVLKGTTKLLNRVHSIRDNDLTLIKSEDKFCLRKKRGFSLCINVDNQITKIDLGSLCGNQEHSYI